MVVANNEKWWYTYKYRDWFINRRTINKLQITNLMFQDKEEKWNKIDNYYMKLLIEYLSFGDTNVR